MIASSLWLWRGTGRQFDRGGCYTLEEIQRVLVSTATGIAYLAGRRQRVTLHLVTVTLTFFNQLVTRGFYHRHWAPTPPRRVLYA